VDLVLQIKSYENYQKMNPYINGLGLLRDPIRFIQRIFILTLVGSTEDQVRGPIHRRPTDLIRQTGSFQKSARVWWVNSLQ
jgi:hypothetical protein